MGNATLNLLGVGTHLPTPRPVVDLVKAAHGEPAGYEGWPQVGVAGDDDHPSTMGARALEGALAQAGVKPEQLKLVLACGVSRDYPPSWSVAYEIMRQLAMPNGCFGLDLTIGCLGTLTGLETARGWLEAHGGGYAAVVNAERWNYTVDYADPTSQALWGHSDGASAAVVALDGRGLAVYRGAEFSSDANMNGYIIVKNGGTRHPVTPPGESPFTRRLADKPKSEVFQAYVHGYMRAFIALKERHGAEADALVCNQISPNFTMAIGGVAGLSPDKVVTTGPRSGHVGSADLLIGVRQLAGDGRLRGRVFMAASTPYAFGAGLLTAD